jgi:hypothetical protein
MSLSNRSVPSENDANQTVECPSCGQQVSAETIAAMGQAREVEWLYQREVATGHSRRFRKVSTRYPRRVADAYDCDLERAAADSDEAVAANVAAWERRQGIEVRDWAAIGAFEREDDLLFETTTVDGIPW